MAHRSALCVDSPRWGLGSGRGVLEDLSVGVIGAVRCRLDGRSWSHRCVGE